MATRRPKNRPHTPARGPGGRFVARPKAAGKSGAGGRTATGRARKSPAPAEHREAAPVPAPGPALPAGYKFEAETERDLEQYIAGQAPQSKLTVDRVKLLCTAAVMGVPLVLAAEQAGITRETYYSWRERHSVISDILTRAEAAHAVAALTRIVAAAEAGDWRADAWWLERRRPDEFSKTQRLEGDVSVGLKSSDLVAELDSTPPTPNAA